MRPIPPPHPTQNKAIRHPAHRLFVEAGPGTGKTFVVAERFGRLAFGRNQIGPKVLALSFTVSATGVLRRTLRRRWGPQAVEFPNRVQTFDSLFREVLEFALRRALITWPGGHFAIEPIDEWENRQPATGREPIAWEARLRGREVQPTKIEVDKGDAAVTARKRLAPQISAGRCTHDSIREIVVEAARNSEIRARIIGFLHSVADTVIVDELFDANRTDVEVLLLLLEAGCSMTLVGDPWQALYEFRNKVPVDIDADLIQPSSFVCVSLSTSFRFTPGGKAEVTAELARLGLPCRTLPVVPEPNVALAGEWSQLWGAGPDVLPLAFGQVRTQFDAIMTLLLDQAVRARGFEGARFTSAALSKLRIDQSTTREGQTQPFDPVINMLMSGDDVDCALEALSLIPKTHFGSDRKLSVTCAVVNRHGPQLRALKARLLHQGQQIAGLTIHQAKGNEWDRVAVVLSDDDELALQTGLDIGDPDHRRLYVALTRGREEVGRYS